MILFRGAVDLRPRRGVCMPTNFDQIIERRGSNSLKWQKYPEDVLPLWVADMDFAAPEPIMRALRQKVDHGIFGYEMPSPQLAETVAGRMQKLYGWRVSPETVVATPGVVAGFDLAARTVCTTGQGILVQPPVYPPFLSVHTDKELLRQEAPLSLAVKDGNLHYSVDLDRFEQAIHSGGARTGMFLLCNPHNPTGQAYSRSDLTCMAEACLKNGATICSDEIHSELLPGGVEHFPLAALDPEVGNHTITLIARARPSMSPGCSVALRSSPTGSCWNAIKRPSCRMRCMSAAWAWQPHRRRTRAHATTGLKP